MSKAFDRIIKIVLSLNNARTIKCMNKRTLFCSVFSCVYKLNFSSSWNSHFSVLVYITVSMTSNCNRLFPRFNIWFDSFYNNRSSEYCTIKDCTNCTIWTLPHFLKVVFSHACCIRSDCCALNSNSIFLCGFS